MLKVILVILISILTSACSQVRRLDITEQVRAQRTPLLRDQWPPRIMTYVFSPDADAIIYTVRNSEPSCDMVVLPTEAFELHQR